MKKPIKSPLVPIHELNAKFGSLDYAARLRRKEGARKLMDPDANLREQLTLARRLVEHSNPDIAKLAELVLALDGWIRRGGFKPRAWTVPTEDQ